MLNLVGFEEDESGIAKGIEMEFENIKQQFTFLITGTNGNLNLLKEDQNLLDEDLNLFTEDQVNFEGTPIGISQLEFISPFTDANQHELNSPQINPILLEPDTVKRLKRNFSERNSNFSSNSILYSPTQEEPNIFVSPTDFPHTPTRIHPVSTMKLSNSNSPMKTPVTGKLCNILSSIKKVTNSFRISNGSSPVRQKILFDD